MNNMNKYLNRNNKTQGVTLVSLVVTIIVLLILIGVVITVSLNTNLLGLAKDTKPETIEAGINDYAKAVKSAVITDKKVTQANIVDSFVAQVEKDNTGKTEATKYEVVARDTVQRI